MKHATAAALDRLEPLLAEIRKVEGLVEKSRGVFYRRSKAFLHFHEDPTGDHADVRGPGDFERFKCETPQERLALLRRVEVLAKG
ncbi:MAG: hypothetical protein JWP35_1648 [Caulobacter sp.]|nr:hypothetical protein [Caulobacter sp.]